MTDREPASSARDERGSAAYESARCHPLLTLVALSPTVDNMGAREFTTREFINADLRDARDAIDRVTCQDAVWGPCASYDRVLAAVREARSVLDVVERRAVREFREEDRASWAEVGNLLGMTRQAAHKKYAHV